jgi:hypothetical protein
MWLNLLMDDRQNQMWLNLLMDDRHCDNITKPLEGEKKRGT